MIVRAILTIAAGIAAVAVLFGADVDAVKALAVGLLCLAVAVIG